MQEHDDQDAAAGGVVGPGQEEAVHHREAVVTRDHQNWKGNLDPSLMKLAGLNPDEFRKPTYPVDYLKIDRHFIQGIETDARKRVVLSQLIGMAHTLGVQVIAAPWNEAVALRVARYLEREGVVSAPPAEL